MKKDYKQLDKLIDEHWKWVEGLLETFPDETMYGLAMTEYLYKTAFKHGYKHGCEKITVDEDSVK